jgi:hypothetical protein
MEEELHGKDVPMRMEKQRNGVQVIDTFLNKS